MNAKQTIMRALNCEEEGYLLEALQLYEEGIEKLKILVEEEGNPSKQLTYKKHLKEYESHVRDISRHVQQHQLNSKLVSQILIESGSRGHSYESLFGNYLDNTVKEVHLYEPYLKDRHQLQNLISFMELLAKKCRNLKYVRVITKMDRKNPKSQKVILKQITADLAEGNITFNYRFENMLHDRKILLSNGIVIKIGRGLHFFKTNASVFALGMCDYDFRRCLQTEVDIWRSKPFTEFLD